MAKGVSIKFKSYEETIPKLLNLIKFEKELKKHDKVVLKPFLRDSQTKSTAVEFAESILKFCLEHKNPVAEVFIAEGSDGEDTMELFNQKGYKRLSEKYSIGLIDLNYTETELLEKPDFLKFGKVYYPKILLESFVISIPPLDFDAELEVIDSLTNMIGAFPAEHYSGLFSAKKKKIKKWPIKYSICDIIICKIPNFAIIDASEKGWIISGIPIEIDKHAAKLLGKDWKEIGHLNLIEKELKFKKEEKKEIEETQKNILTE